jgi:hypothetical protein
MKESRLLGAVCAAAFSVISMPSNAALVYGQGTWETTLQARDMDGNTSTIEAYYDTVLDITWLADANYSIFWLRCRWANDLGCCKRLGGGAGYQWHH